MLWIPSKKTRRFSVYHLEENEIYIRDFAGSCSYTDPATSQQRAKEKGKFYICSKTIVFESEQQNTPLLKFKYDSMLSEPVKGADPGDNKLIEFIHFVVRRMVTIKSSIKSPPEPFKHYQDIKMAVSNENTNVGIYPSYEEAQKLIDWLKDLFSFAKKKAAYDLQQHIYELIKDKEDKPGFNMSLVDSVSEKPLLEESSIFSRRIIPLNHIYGYMFLTDSKVYFQPFHSITGKSVHKIELKEIGQLYKRRFELREIGLEIITVANKSYYFTFESPNIRNKVFNKINENVSERCLKLESLEQITYKWQNSQISNYEYLMHLNQVGNRSFSDLSQYPVFPWVLTDYISQTIDLTDHRVYRDLSKPIGALNPTRLRAFLERYEDMPPPKFMYGSHYSAPGYVIGYLVRKKPQYMLKLQSGRFDKPDRLFKSIKGDWQNVIENPTSLKELIPQFYENDPSFLLNHLNLDLGVRQNKKKVGDVKLPKWSKGDPALFLQTMRKALESSYVSSHLHLWIDLIFGYKQRGDEAIKACNLFNHVTYEGGVDVEQITDPIEKLGLKCQINEFGQCPKQIFKLPHPPRGSLTVLSNIPPTIMSAEHLPAENENRTSPTKLMEASSLYSTDGKAKVKTVMSQGKTSDIEVSEISKAHKMPITRMLVLSSKPNTAITIGHDGFLKVFDLAEKACLKSFKLCQFCLSSIVPLKVDEIFAIGSWDNSIYIFNIIYGSKSKPISAHDNSVSDLVYLPQEKMLLSASWDCSIKSWRLVGNNLQNIDIFYDHENQITSLAADSQEQTLAFGDIEGNIVCLNISSRQKIYQLNIKNQKICKVMFIANNLVATAEEQIKMINPKGQIMAVFSVDGANGTIRDSVLDGQHLYCVTTKKHLGLYDMLQQKKLGSYFNDFKTSEEDKLPSEKQLTCVSINPESTVVLIGSMSGTIYLLKS